AQVNKLVVLIQAVERGFVVTTGTMRTVVFSTRKAMVARRSPRVRTPGPRSSRLVPRSGKVTGRFDPIDVITRPHRSRRRLFFRDLRKDWIDRSTHNTLAVAALISNGLSSYSYDLSSHS